jgi:hypothetical protein
MYWEMYGETVTSFGKTGKVPYQRLVELRQRFVQFVFQHSGLLFDLLIPILRRIRPSQCSSLFNNLSVTQRQVVVKLLHPPSLHLYFPRVQIREVAQSQNLSLRTGAWGVLVARLLRVQLRFQLRVVELYLVNSQTLPPDVVLRVLRVRRAVAFHDFVLAL